MCVPQPLAPAALTTEHGWPPAHHYQCKIFVQYGKIPFESHAKPPLGFACMGCIGDFGTMAGDSELGAQRQAAADAVLTLASVSGKDDRLVHSSPHPNTALSSSTHRPVSRALQSCICWRRCTRSSFGCDHVQVGGSGSRNNEGGRVGAVRALALLAVAGAVLLAGSITLSYEANAASHTASLKQWLGEGLHFFADDDMAADSAEEYEGSSGEQTQELMALADVEQATTLELSPAVQEASDVPVSSRRDAAASPIISESSVEGFDVGSSSQSQASAAADSLSASVTTQEHRGTTVTQPQSEIRNDDDATARAQSRTKAAQQQDLPAFRIVTSVNASGCMRPAMHAAHTAMEAYAHLHGYAFSLPPAPPSKPAVIAKLEIILVSARIFPSIFEFRLRLQPTWCEGGY